MPNPNATIRNFFASLVGGGLSSLRTDRVFANRQDGRIAYVDFGNVAQLSNRNKQILVDAVVHAVNEDYRGMADDFINLVSARAPFSLRSGARGRSREQSQRRLKLSHVSGERGRETPRERSKSRANAG